MKVAVLPLNASAGTPPALGRQISNFVSDIARVNSGAEINAVSYLTQVQDNGEVRAAFANVADVLLEPEWVGQMFEQADMDLIMDGLLKIADGHYDITVRFFEKGTELPVTTEVWSFDEPELFAHVDKLIKLLGERTGMPVKSENTLEFGTDKPIAFLNFLEGYDAMLYVQQANGQVVRDFSPQPAIEKLLEAVRLDPDFVAPFDTLVQFCRLCANYRIGTFEALRDALMELTKLVPDDYKPWFALGEIFSGVGQESDAAEYYEKAISLEDNDPALYARLGISQITMGMPVNAERNLRKAFDLEGDDKPSADWIAQVLMQTNRVHEIPSLWKSLVELNPQNGIAHAKYALSLIQVGQAEEGEKVYESALETLEDNLVIKRYYAPYLVQKNDLDRAMDFYEDCLDFAPTDVETMTEYARVLQLAGREFEIPKVLQDILAASPDQNVRAQTLGWLIELEQPKRVESVTEAQQKLQEGDADGAVKILKPLRNWLADYWKLWAMLANAYNSLKEFPEAEEAAQKLLQLFPACEPGYGELVTALNGQGKNDEAYSLMRYAATNLPQSLPIYVNLALAAKRAGHEDEAKSLAKQIREVVGPNEELEPILVEIEA